MRRWAGAHDEIGPFDGGPTIRIPSSFALDAVVRRRRATLHPAVHTPRPPTGYPMYAVIESGGKQYRVELGSEIQVDRLEVQPGETITLERVLLVADDEQATVGRPFVE